MAGGIGLGPLVGRVDSGEHMTDTLGRQARPDLLPYRCRDACHAVGREHVGANPSGVGCAGRLVLHIVHPHRAGNLSLDIHKIEEICPGGNALAQLREVLRRIVGKGNGAGRVGLPSLPPRL